MLKTVHHLATVKRADDERFRAMKVEERLQLFLELCDLTDSIVNQRPEHEQLRQPTRRSAESEALWRRLMRREPLGG